MRFSITYITLKLKELFHSKIYIGFGLFILLLGLIMAPVMPQVNSNSPYTLAILNEHTTKVGEGAITVLEQDGGYSLRRCDSRRELEALVLSGEVLCGYEFDEEADMRIQKKQYTGLVNGFYREKSPAAALCDEAVCGAIFRYLSPIVVRRYLEQNKMVEDARLQGLEDNFEDVISGESMMKVILLGGQGQLVGADSGHSAINFLYSILYSLTAIFAVTTAFYTNSIDKAIVFAGQKSALVGICSFISYFISYLIILAAAHIIIAAFISDLLTNTKIIGGLLLTALAGGVLQVFARRFLTPGVISLLPFIAVILVAAINL